MSGAAATLYEHVSGQLRALCDAIGLPSYAPLNCLCALMDAADNRSPAESPMWPSGVSDDHTPLEYSIACDAGKPPVLRILGEAIAAQPSRAANLRAALRLVDTLDTRLGLALDRFHLVRPVFLDGVPKDDFTLWFSLVHRFGQRPQVKVYLNPAVRGPNLASPLVAEALRRLRLGRAYTTVLDHGMRRGDLDRFAFFALDLHARPDARTKVYLSHHDADGDDLLRAAGALRGVDHRAIADFLELTGCTGPLTRRPAVSGYTFVGTETVRPTAYSLYLPIRDYVRDDDEARDVVLAVADRFGLDTRVIDRAITAVARRPLHAGVGLIPHVALRLATNRAPGVTVYLSAEAYQVCPPRVPSGSVACR